ncbi:hypothetical protein [Candidatus Binatus sp.]|jgi:hypothetical protein|uniref:hypothetical protein n=1 Tax=Candidatus Binatus sp. TaxID=2811406 RepID=UPI003C37BB6A
MAARRFDHRSDNTLKRRLLFQIAALAILAGVARAQPAPQLGPSAATMWPYTQPTGGNLLPSKPFGTVSGGCNLAGWKFLNQNKAVWSAVPDPIGGVESGNCVAEIAGAASSTLSQVADQSLMLSPGFYSIRCNIASANDNSAQLTIQYLYAGSGTPPTGVKIIFGTNPNDHTGGTAASLRTVVTGGSSADPLCINLLNPAATAVTNPNDCHTTVWAYTLGQLAKMINADPNYHAAIVGSSTNVLADALNPSQSGQDILTYCPAGATCPPYQAYPVSGTNLLFGYNCRVGGINTAFGTNRIFGNAPQWVNPTPHGDLGEVSPSSSKVSYKLQTWSRPTGTGYFGMGRGTGLFRLADPDANLMVRFPNYLHTYVDTLADGADLRVDYRSVTRAACSGTPDCPSGQCEMELLSGSSIVAHQCVRPRTSWQTAAGFGFSGKPGGDYTVQLAGIKSLTPSAKISKLANIPVAWNGFFDANNWLHKRIPGSFSHANTTRDILDFSGPLLALGFYDTQAGHVDLAGNECVLNGVAGTPVSISSISESGTTISVATAAPHGLSNGRKAAIAQLHEPLAAAAYDNSNFGPITVTDSTHFTFTAARAGLPSVTNDGVVGQFCAGGQGFIGDVARNARLDLYLNYFLGISPTAAIVQLGNALQEEPGGGILRIDAVNAAFYPWKGYDPELTGNVLSADKANTGCYCTCGPTAKPKCVGAINPLSNSTWNIAGYCGPNNSTMSRPSYYPGDFCAPVLFDDLDHRLGGEGNNPPGLGSASQSVQTGDPSFFGMYVHDEPTMEFLPKVQSLVQYVRTYSRSTPTFGAFIYGFAQTPNQLSVWRDVDDVPMIDNYPIAANFPIGGSSPTSYPTLTPGPAPFPTSEGVQQSVWKVLLSVNGDPTTLPITPGTRPIAFVEQDWGGAKLARWPTFSQAENMAWLAIFGGTNAIMFWSAGTLGEYYIRACPDYGASALACQAQHKATVTIPLLHELVEYNPFIVSTDKHAVPGLPAGVFGYQSTATEQKRTGPKVETRVFTANATAAMQCDSESPRRCWAPAGQQGSTRLNEVPWFH